MKKIVDYYNGLSEEDCKRLNLVQKDFVYFTCDKCSKQAKFNYHNQDLCLECFEEVTRNKWLQLPVKEREKILMRHQQYYYEMPIETIAKELKINFKSLDN